ncbi:MAG: PP2C family protein-serine/threonine phosphatase [Candidatus Krumholzibacteriota bacterium]|nr:PP2C family protein-serine/threonine phosphatase [Candidatus Krumholzibacteriota bacterium]
MSLKVQITFFVIMLVAGVVGAFSWTIARVQKKIILQEMTEIVILQGRNLALSYSKPLLHSDPEFELHPHISRVLENNADIIRIVVVDRVGIIKGHGDLRMIDSKYVPPAGLIRAKYVTHLLDREDLREDEDILEARIPVIDQDETIGYVYLAYSKQRMREALKEIYNRIIKIGLIALAVGSLVSLLLVIYITKPVSILTDGAELIGKGNFETRIKVRSVKEIQVLADTFNQMALRLEKGREAMREKERMDKELEIAKSIQETLLPSDIPKMKNFELDAFYNPAAQVGGDYFDLIPVDKNRLMLVVGDVAGKGVPGLVIMAMARIIVRDLAQRGESPARLLRYLNVLLKRDIKENLFLTMFCGVLDVEKKTFDFASAAHMPLCYYRHDEKTVYMLPAQAKPLGFFPDEVFSSGLEESRLIMKPGDLIMQYTDGLNETRNAAGEEFGLERLKDLIAVAAPGGARRVLSAVRENLERFRGETPRGDDLTLLAVNLLSADSGMESKGTAESPETITLE